MKLLSLLVMIFIRLYSIECNQVVFKSSKHNTNKDYVILTSNVTYDQKNSYLNLVMDFSRPLNKLYVNISDSNVMSYD